MKKMSNANANNANAANNASDANDVKDANAMNKPNNMNNVRENFLITSCCNIGILGWVNDSLSMLKINLGQINERIGRQ